MRGHLGIQEWPPWPGVPPWPSAWTGHWGLLGWGQVSHNQARQARISRCSFCMSPMYSVLNTQYSIFVHVRFVSSSWFWCWFDILERAILRYQTYPTPKLIKNIMDVLIVPSTLCVLIWFSTLKVVIVPISPEVLCRPAAGWS